MTGDMSPMDDKGDVGVAGSTTGSESSSLRAPPPDAPAPSEAAGVPEGEPPGSSRGTITKGNDDDGRPQQAPRVDI